MSAIKHAIYDIAHFKASPDDNGHRGEFEALVSVFGNVDLQGDRVVKGAFQKSLARWRERGDPVPLIWAHDWGDPHAHIGKADPNDVEETDEGLKLKGSLDLDNPFAAQVFRLLKERRVREFSFGYSIAKERTAKDGANELVDLDIIEAGPTLKGANPNTQLLSVKSDLEAAAKGLKTPPWHVEADYADCDGFAVIADETGEVVGCHSTRKEAEDHMAALYANVEDVAKGLKAGRRISRATETELSTAIDGMEKELARLRGLLSLDSDDEKDEDEAEAPVGKASDDDLLRYTAAIEAALLGKESRL